MTTSRTSDTCCRPDAGFCRHLEEYAHLRRLLGNDVEIWKTLQHQFSVVYQRTQTIFALGALAITVTGFSGHRMVAAGPWSGVPLVIGLLLVLTALIMAMYGVGTLRWMSTFRSDGAPLDPGPESLGCPDDNADAARTFALIIRARDRKSLLFRRALRILVIGLGFYVLAVCNYLLKASLGNMPLL